MTRPRPTPRPRPKPKAAEAKPATGETEQKEVTHHGHRFRKSVEPIGFAAAMFCKNEVSK